MKKINLIISILVLFAFAYIYKPVSVNADSTATWSEKILWSDGTTSQGYQFKLWGYNFSQTLTQNNIIWFNVNQSPFGFDARIIVSDENLYTDAIVKAEVYILSSFPIRTGKHQYYSTYDSENDYLTVTKVADEVTFRGNSGYGSVYKFTYSFKNRDCMDSEFGGRYLCFGDGFTRTFGFGAINSGDNNLYAIQLYGFGKVTYSDIRWGQPDDSNVDDMAKLSVWDTIKALPGKLLSWFTSLPGNIWNGIKTGFNWVVDALGSVVDVIVDLPGNIWNGLKTGFNWITDGLINLGTFLLNGLKDLFIPSDLSVDSLVDSFKTKLGFVYDVPSTVISYGLNLSNVNFNEMNSISLPTITIFGHNFWTSQNIDISASINTFKPYRYLTSIACVVFCVNALFKYKDKIFGGGGNYN